MTAPVPWEQTNFDPWTPVDAKHAFEAAKRRATFSADCPKVERGGYTVADREAFIERAGHEERQAYEIATAGREAAQDHLRTLNSQSVVMSSLAKNVQQTYGVVGTR